MKASHISVYSVLKVPSIYVSDGRLLLGANPKTHINQSSELSAICVYKWLFRQYRRIASKIKSNIHSVRATLNLGIILHTRRKRVCDFKWVTDDLNHSRSISNSSSMCYVIPAATTTTTKIVSFCHHQLLPDNNNIKYLWKIPTKRTSL